MTNQEKVQALLAQLEADIRSLGSVFPSGSKIFINQARLPQRRVPYAILDIPGFERERGTPAYDQVKVSVLIALRLKDPRPASRFLLQTQTFFDLRARLTPSAASGAPDGTYAGVAKLPEVQMADFTDPDDLEEKTVTVGVAFTCLMFFARMES